MQLFVDNLTNIDFSYLHPERGLVGETWLVSIVLDGALDEQGMVCDFGIVKKTVKQWMDDTIDHSLVIPRSSPALSNFEQSEHDYRITWQYGHGKHLDCHSPHQAFTVIDTTEINPESVSQWCIAELAKHLPDTIDRIEIQLVPEKIQHHFYHYSHGLKKHAGNCQRIAHGHRSTIEITENGERLLDLEKNWCAQWQDIYLGTVEDLQEKSLIEGQEYFHFAYQAEQGEFALSLPSEDCDLIDTDTTVEWIAVHIAKTLNRQYPKQSITVKAFEGMGKGSISSVK